MSKNTVPDFNLMSEKLVNLSYRHAAVESVKFFKESFRNQGFTDSSFKAWPQSKNLFKRGTKTLYNEGTLMQSIRAVESTRSRVVVENDTRYSEFNNNGASITVTEGMKAHFWKLYYELIGDSKNTTNYKKLKLNQKAEFCKRMALLKIGTIIKIPQRQFMGNSQTMMNQFDTFWHGQVDIVFKQHLNNK